MFWALVGHTNHVVRNHDKIETVEKFGGHPFCVCLWGDDVFVRLPEQPLCDVLHGAIHVRADQRQLVFLWSIRLYDLELDQRPADRVAV